MKLTFAHYDIENNGKMDSHQQEKTESNRICLFHFRIPFNEEVCKSGERIRTHVKNARLVT